MQRRNVLLPEPLAPRIDTTSPSRASSEMPFSTSWLPKDLWMSVTERATGVSAILFSVDTLFRQWPGTAMADGTVFGRPRVCPESLYSSSPRSRTMMKLSTR